MENTEKLLKLLEKNAMLTNEQLGSMLGVSAAEVEKMKSKLLDDGIIKGSSIFYDDGGATVKAIIEISVTPAELRNEIATALASCPQVKNLYLVASEEYDFSAFVEANDMSEISDFVADFVSHLEGVKATATHVLMKRYKESGFNISTKKKDKDERVDL